MRHEPLKLPTPAGTWLAQYKCQCFLTSHDSSHMCNAHTNARVLTWSMQFNTVLYAYKQRFLKNTYCSILTNQNTAGMHRKQAIIKMHDSADSVILPANL